MLRKLYLFIIIVLLASIAVSCGTVAERMDQEASIAEETDTDSAATEEADAQAMPTEEADADSTATEEADPDIVVTEEADTDSAATEEANSDNTISSEEERIAALVEAADAAAGQATFTTAGCSACHRVDEETVLVGPGLLNIFARAGSRVEGQGPHEYVFTSIRSSQAFIVDGFAAGIMPLFNQLSDDDLYNIMAYLKTLEG